MHASGASLSLESLADLTSVEVSWLLLLRLEQCPGHLLLYWIILSKLSNSIILLGIIIYHCTCPKVIIETSIKFTIILGVIGNLRQILLHSQKSIVRLLTSVKHVLGQFAITHDIILKRLWELVWVLGVFQLLRNEF